MSDQNCKRRPIVTRRGPGVFVVPVPLSSWGNMLSLSTDQFRSAPWLVYPPGAMIFVTVLSVFLVSDGLRDALDPRLYG